MIELREQINLVDPQSKPQLLDMLANIVFLYREGDTESKSSATYQRDWHHKTLTIKVSFE